MAKINIASTGHGSKLEIVSGVSGGGGWIIHYNVFPNATATDKTRLAMVTKAYNIINDLDKKLDLNGPCNRYFRTLPKGKSFRQCWRDDTNFINFSPSAGVYCGRTHSNRKDICVTAWCLDNHNHWKVAATIVHEFAHVGGAVGGDSHAAEKAVEKCGFKDQYDPAIWGSIKQLGYYLETIT